MEKNDKIPVTVYQIDLIPFEEPGFNFVVDEIIRSANDRKMAREKKMDFDEHRLELEPGTLHNVRLFFNCFKYHPKWKPFLSGIVLDGSKITIAKNTINSFVCFIQLEKNIYAIAAGRGSGVLERYVDQNFGLSLLVRIIDQQSKVIKQIQERGVSGIVLGQTKHYRGEQKIGDENHFGRIFKEVKAELSKYILASTFGFSEDELGRKSSGLFKNSFKLGKAIDFNRLLDLVGIFDKLLAMEGKYHLNKVHLIEKRHPRGAELIGKLDELLLESVFDNCKAGILPDVDICHQDFDVYMNADGYELVINGEKKNIDFEHTPSFEAILFELKKRNLYTDTSYELFKADVLYRQIRSTDGGGLTVTMGSVLEHINGGVQFDSHSYFKVDGLWYRILPSFIKDLNTDCKCVINERWDTTQLDKRYPNLVQTERKYNRNYLGCAQTLVFDTITPDYIEACDILTWDSSSIHLIHVKKGFNNSARELCSQIVVSARRLEEDIRAGYKGVDKLEKLTKKAGDPELARQNFPPEGLKGKFQNVAHKNIVFCLAVVDVNPTERSLKDNINAFRSNIAKYSLIDMVPQVVGMGFDVKIIQIKR